MNLDEAKQLVDYFVRTSGGNLSIEIASGAVAVSLISILITVYSFHQQHSHSIYTYLAGVWYDILNTTINNPDFMDIMKTVNYYNTMSHEQALKYDIYCYKIWGHVEDIVAKKFHEDPQFAPVIRWVCAYHRSWLSRNPTFFTLDEFWRIVEHYKDMPNIVLGGRMVPTKGDGIDWDTIAHDYHRYILGPFAPEMVATANGRCRNLLLNYLAEIPDAKIKEMDIADFGCGPGNLIEFLSGRAQRLIGIDSSRGTLDVAINKARAKSMAFEAIEADMRQVPAALRFDLIISANSILPKERSEIVPILKAMRAALKPSGRIIAILPSFDTIEYLMSLWERYYLRETNSRAHIKRILDAFAQTKKLDRQQLSYADDGHNVQCYHTLETIKLDFKSAGLCLVKDPEKIYYPWNLTRRFDYGYFPDAREEIWDWFVIAESNESDPAAAVS